jgi:hypothetical protein
MFRGTNLMSELNNGMPERIYVQTGKDGHLSIFERKALTHDNDVEYTRTDTLLSKAEVAREFMEASQDLYIKNQCYGIWRSMQETLTKWMDEDGAKVDKKAKEA